MCVDKNKVRDNECHTQTIKFSHRNHKNTTRKSTKIELRVRSGSVKIIPVQNLGSNMNTLYLRKRGQSLLRCYRVCFKYQSYKIWLATYKGCFGCETKWFWSNRLLDDFPHLSVPTDSENMSSFWHHNLCLIQFCIGSLISFRTVSGAMPEQGFSSRDKREKLLTKFDGLIYPILLTILWYQTSLFSLFLKNINISKFNVLKLDFWQFCNYLLYFITSSKIVLNKF